MPRELENYLRTYRRRSGFTQDEIAFLLGGTCGSKVSRYERRRRQPTLRTLFAYEVLFDVGAAELFAGIFRRVEGAVVKRALSLAKELSAHPTDKVTARKLAALEALLMRARR